MSKTTQKTEEKIDKANKEKEMGNKFFKEGINAKAIYHYHSALMYVKGLHGLSTEETKKVNEIKVACNNNLAAVQLKEGKIERVISCCTQVLEIEPNNVKALFRRGKAYLGKDNLDKAEDDLNKVASLDPNDKAIQKELVVLKQKSKDQDKKQKKFYANMFEKISQEDKKEIQANSKSQPVTESGDFDPNNYQSMESIQ